MADEISGQVQELQKLNDLTEQAKRAQEEFGNIADNVSGKVKDGFEKVNETVSKYSEMLKNSGTHLSSLLDVNIGLSDISKSYDKLSSMAIRANENSQNALAE